MQAQDLTMSDATDAAPARPRFQLRTPWIPVTLVLLGWAPLLVMIGSLFVGDLYDYSMYQANEQTAWGLIFCGSTAVGIALAWTVDARYIGASVLCTVVGLLSVISALIYWMQDGLGISSKGDDETLHLAAYWNYPAGIVVASLFGAMMSASIVLELSARRRAHRESVT